MTTTEPTPTLDELLDQAKRVARRELDRIEAEPKLTHADALILRHVTESLRQIGNAEGRRRFGNTVNSIWRSR